MPVKVKAVRKKKVAITKESVKKQVATYKKYCENDERWIPGCTPEKPGHFFVTIQWFDFEGKPTKKIVTMGYFNKEAEWDIKGKIYAYMYPPKAYVSKEKREAASQSFAEKYNMVGGWTGTKAHLKEEPTLTATKRIGILSKLVKGKSRSHKNDAA